LTPCVQVPRNDFYLLMYGAKLEDIKKVSLIPNSQTCQVDAYRAMDSTHTGARNVSAFSPVAGTYVAKFEWFSYGCAPTSDGAWSDQVCPQAGWYRLCYMTADNVPGNESNMIVFVEQANVTITTSYFTIDMIHEVYTPFAVAVQLVDTSGLPCCSGSTVYLTCRKNGADHGSYLYNAAGSNSPINRTVVANSQGVAIFSNYTIRFSAGTKYYLTASVPGHSVNIPPDIDGVQGFFQVKPNRMRVVTEFAPEYIVGSAVTVTLPSAVTVRAEDRYGHLLVGLNASDGLHCEVQLQTGGFGSDSAVNTSRAGVGNASVTPDLEPAGVQSGGEGRPLFQGGIAVLEHLTILNQAGRYLCS
jgi:hypothetical protein